MNSLHNSIFTMHFINTCNATEKCFVGVSTEDEKLEYEGQLE